MYIKGFKMPHTLSGFYPNEPILVALSGGADSSLLLQQLWIYSKEYETKLFAAHLNHKIRGADADRDEKFCQRLCERLGIEFFSKSVDVPSLAALSGESLETVARNERYKFFYQIMLSRRISILATAHNADDSLETQIFNFARGTGLRGLCGIPSVRKISDEVPGGVIIRPMIGCQKADILTFCHENGIEYVTDATNADTDYSRNRIRHLVIPELEKISPGVRENATRLAAISGEDEDFFDREVEKILQNSGGEITASELLSLHPAIAKRVISRLCYHRTEYCHLTAALELCRKHSGNGTVPYSLSLPNKLRLTVAEDGRLTFSPDTRKKKALSQAQSSEPKAVYIQIPCEGEALTFVLGDAKITVKRLKSDSDELMSFKRHLSDMNSTLNVYNRSTYLLLKSDRIIGTVYARKYLAGDSILRGSTRKAVKDIMRESGMPKTVRAKIPIFCLINEKNEETILGFPCVAGAVRSGYGIMPEDVDNNTLIINVEDIF